MSKKLKIKKHLDPVNTSRYKKLTCFDREPSEFILEQDRLARKSNHHTVVGRSSPFGFAVDYTGGHNLLLDSTFNEKKMLSESLQFQESRRFVQPSGVSLGSIVTDEDEQLGTINDERVQR